MKRKWNCVVLFLLCGTMALWAGGCGEKNALRQKAEGMVDQMTLEQQIGQMLMPAFRTWEKEDVFKLEPEHIDLIKELGLGGVILFGENFSSTQQTVELTQSLQEAAAEGGTLPLLIGTDQEGGAITRLAEGTGLPGNMALGASPDEKDSYLAGTILGSELAALGINLDFAPSLDINNNPKNPVIGVRSFSGDPKEVTARGMRLLQGMQEQDIAVAVKHFPGHGDTAIDSHVGLPLVDKSLEEIRKFELVPFQNAVKKGTDMVMTAHIQYPQIETDTYTSVRDGKEVYLPATLSKQMVTEVLRKQLGFEGVVITDALNMDAIAKEFLPEDVARLAINAGVDILLMPVTIEGPGDIPKLGDYVNQLVAMVEAEEIDPATVRSAAVRIVALKLGQGLLEEKERDSSIVGSEAHLALEREITRRTITVTQNEQAVLPLQPKEGQKILLLGAYENELPALEFGCKRLIKEGLLPAGLVLESMEFMGAEGKRDQEKLKAITQAVNTADAVIVISEVGREKQLDPAHWSTGSVDDILAAAKKKGVPCVVLSVDQPYDVARYPQADAVLAVYNSAGMTLGSDGEPKGMYGPNIPTAMDVIFGACEAVGTLPVDIMKIGSDGTYTNEVLYPAGYGLSVLKPTEK